MASWTVSLSGEYTLADLHLPVRATTDLTLARVTQQPFKTAYYAALLLQLSIKSDNAANIKEEADVEAEIGDKRKAEDDGEADCGREVMESMHVAFRNWVETQQWFNVRQCVSDVDAREMGRRLIQIQLHFFSLLLPAGLVTGHSLLGLYKSLLSVLKELGGGGDRAERVIRAVGEGLLRVSDESSTQLRIRRTLTTVQSGQNLQAQFPDEVADLIGSIEEAILGRSGGRTNNDPLNPILPDGQEPEPYQDVRSAKRSQCRTSAHGIGPWASTGCPSRFPVE